jgi:hypothetical protein
MDEQVDLISTHITTSDISGFFWQTFAIWRKLYFYFFWLNIPFFNKKKFPKKSKNLPCFLHIVQASG